MMTTGVAVVAVLVVGLIIFSKVNYEGINSERMGWYMSGSAVMTFIVMVFTWAMIPPVPKTPDPYQWEYACVQKGGLIAKDYVKAPGKEAEYFDTCRQPGYKESNTEH